MLEPRMDHSPDLTSQTKLQVRTMSGRPSQYEAARSHSSRSCQGQIEISDEQVAEFTRQINDLVSLVQELENSFKMITNRLSAFVAANEDAEVEIQQELGTNQ